MMRIRPAIPKDAIGISAILIALVAARKRTRPSNADSALHHYISHPDCIQCTVAEEDDTILGFRALKLATTGNIYGVTPGWGIIGTHINPDAARRGIGKALFAATWVAAQNAGLTKIDATIGETNNEGLGYYKAMGFRTYRTANGTICKCFNLTQYNTL